MYLDLYFLKNLLFVFWIIISEKVIHRKQIRLVRIILASVLLAGLLTYMLWRRMPIGTGYFAFGFIGTIIAEFVVGWENDKKALLADIIYYYCLSIIYAKTYMIALFITHEKAVYVKTLIVFLLAIGPSIWFLGQCYLDNTKYHIYRVVLKHKGQRNSICGYMDTGNRLIDPITQKPVCVVEKDAVCNLIPLFEENKYRIIPFTSIGEENGVMEGTQIERMDIWIGHRRLVKKNVIIALYKGSLSTKEDYQMLLHQELMQ